VPEACEPVSCPVPVPWRAPACARVLPSAISSGPLSAARHPAEPVAAERVGRQRRRKCMGPRFGHNHDRAARAPRAGTRHRAGREPALGTRDRQRPAQDIPARSWQGAPLGEPGPDRAGDLGLPADPLRDQRPDLRRRHQRQDRPGPGQVQAHPARHPPGRRAGFSPPEQARAAPGRVMADTTRNKNLNPGRRHRTCPRAIKPGRHNAYRVKRPGDKNMRHDGPATIRLANPVKPQAAA